MSTSAATYLGEVEVKENSEFSRTIEIYRCESGMLVGVDSRWNGQVKDRHGSELEPQIVAIHCPYDTDTTHILDPEHIAKSKGIADEPKNGGITLNPTSS